MDAQALIIWLIVGGVAGWLAGMVVKGGGYGLIGGHHRWDYRRPHRWLVITAARHCNRWRNYRCDHQCLHRRSHLATYSAVGQAGGLASRSRNLVVLGTAPPLRRCGIRPAGN